MWREFFFNGKFDAPSTVPLTAVIPCVTIFAAPAAALGAEAAADHSWGLKHSKHSEHPLGARVKDTGPACMELQPLNAR